MGGAVDLVRKGAPALRNDDLALLQELVADIDGLVEQAARIAAEVDDEAVDVLAESLSSASPTSRPVVSMKLSDVNVADAGLNHECEIDGRHAGSHRGPGRRRVAWQRLHGSSSPVTCVPLGPLRSLATAAESMPSVDLPSNATG